MKLTNNKKILIAVLFVIFVIAGAIYIFKDRVLSEPMSGNSENILTQEDAYPTVDSSVVVSVTADKNKHNLTLSIQNVPDGTENIDFDIVYGIKGELKDLVAGRIQTKGEKSVIRDSITLGSCSSGVCTYRDVVGGGMVTLRFTGNYGTKIYEGQYDI